MTAIARVAALGLLGLSIGGAAQAAQMPTLVVFFDEWSGALDHAARDVINQAAIRSRQVRGAHIEVAGYADNAGSPEANLALTQLRAHRVAEALERDGIPKGEITIKAEGAQRTPGVASRRVEITISGK
jgi:outer membrane protein OmpA-like peptidoglycan-associated protein